MSTNRLLMLAAVAVIAAAAPATAGGARDRTPPTVPGDFRVTAVTSYSASLSWTGSTDNASTVRYVVSAGTGENVTLPQGARSFTWRSGLLAGYRYTFSIRAVDDAGNSSKPVTATATLPADATPPSAPKLQVGTVGPTHAALSWTAAVDDGPYVTYTIVLEGTQTHVGATTAHALTGLSPGRTYTATVRAADMWGNASTSNPVSFTTPPADASDTTAPTVPGNLGDRGMSFPDGETWLFWEASTDDRTPQSLISYRVFVNGALDHTIVGSVETILYLPTGRTSVIEVVAVDEAGNSSPAAAFTVTVP